MKPMGVESLPALPDVAHLSISIARDLMECGASATLIHEEASVAARALGCDSVEVYCQHAAIIVTLQRDHFYCVQMGKVGEHGVNFRRLEAVRRIVRRIQRSELDCAAAQALLDNIEHTTPSYTAWVVCLSTGLACSAFGRLLGMDWVSLLPVLIASAVGQWIRHALSRRKQNVFITCGLVSFVSAFLAGLGARLLGDSHPAISTVAAVLLLVPGVPVLNTQTDVIEGKPNLAAARGLRVSYLLLFMTLGLIAAQRLVLPGMPGI
jgi:uncharacterized membrane protein YjjP (DUF1212 family)